MVKLSLDVHVKMALMLTSTFHIDMPTPLIFREFFLHTCGKKHGTIYTLSSARVARSLWCVHCGMRILEVFYH